jgi:hypothetical protein
MRLMIAVVHGAHDIGPRQQRRLAERPRDGRRGHRGAAHNDDHPDQGSAVAPHRSSGYKVLCLAGCRSLAARCDDRLDLNHEVTPSLKACGHVRTGATAEVRIWTTSKMPIEEGPAT